MGIGAILAVVWAGLSRLFATRAGQWVGTMLLFLGIGFATKTGVVDPIMDMMQDAFVGLPGSVLEWVAFLNIDVYCSMIASAYVAAAGKRVLLRKLSPA